MYDGDDLLNTSTNYYGSLHNDETTSTSTDNSWRRGKSVSMLVDDDDENDTFASQLYESCDADNWPGFCLCECDVQCARPCCTVRRPLRCAGLTFLILSLFEAIGIFSVGLAIATTEYNQTSSFPSPSPSNTTHMSVYQQIPPTFLNQACSNAIMAMYASVCFAVFSIQSIRDESKIQLTSACTFSILVVLFVALHLHSDRFGALWITVRLPLLIVSSLCSAGVVFLAIPVSTTFGWVAYKTLRNADPVTLGTFQRYNHWGDAASMDFSIWVLVILAGGAFDVGFNFILSTAALGTSLIWWRLGAVAARHQWSTVFSWVYLPLSVCLPSYAGYVAWDFFQGSDGKVELTGMTPVHYLVLVGFGGVVRIVLTVVGCKMRYHEDWELTREVLSAIKETKR